MPRRRPAVLRPAVLAAWIPIFAIHLGLGSVPARGAEPFVHSDQTEAGGSDASGSSSFLSRHRRSLIWISAGGAAASAVTAILFRREANDRYDEYQHTANPEEIADLYAESKHLDEVATGFFIGAEALFVAVIYLGFFVEPTADHQAALAPSSLTPVVARGMAGDARLGLAWHF
jgi:hypothetical protein